MATTPESTFSRIRTLGIWIAVFAVLGLVIVLKGHRTTKHPRLLIGNLAINPASPGSALPLTAGVDTPPEGPNGKLAWFLRNYAERFAAAQHQMALQQGADVETLPHEWPGPRYISDAAAYPSVESYFLGYLRYLDTAKERYPVLIDSIARITVVESKMESADSADVLKGIRGGFAAKRATNLQMFDYGQAYGQAALRLHYYLASLGSRVSYNYTENTAKFAVDAERQKAEALLAEVQQYRARLAEGSKP
ncbi:MAG TPA: hypothetical protein VIM21_01260 [Gemmatimonadaceae bacterium]